MPFGLAMTKDMAKKTQGSLRYLSLGNDWNCIGLEMKKGGRSDA